MPMFETQLSSPRKRRNPEQLAPHQNNTLPHGSKRRKSSHPSGSELPPAFWDNLSKVDLTRRALEELDRRNIQAAAHSQPLHPPSHGPITRRAFVELKKSFQPLKPTAQYFCSCEATGLKTIKQTARHGGPDLSELRGFREPSTHPNPAMSSNRSNSRFSKRTSTSTSRARRSTNTTTTANTGPYNRNFQQNLVDGGVYPVGYEYPDGQVPPLPANWEEINRELAQPRSSLSPSIFSENDFREFKRADAHASKEKQVTTSVIPIIEGNVVDARCVSGGIPFTNLDHLTDGTLVPGNPDIYYGARPEQLDRRVRNELTGHIIPSTQNDLPIAPNFFIAAKGPDGSLAVAGRQACYDGALGARGIHSLQSYGQEDSSYDNNATTITSIYHGGTLKMFTSHPSQSANCSGRCEYYMNQLRAFAMTNNRETFRQGATAYKNARDWAKKQRDEAIRRANERAVGNQIISVNASLQRISSHTSETTRGDDSGLSQESQNSLNETSNTTTVVQEADATSPELTLEHSKQSGQPGRKRRNAGFSDYGLPEQAELQPSGPSELSQALGGLSSESPNAELTSRASHGDSELPLVVPQADTSDTLPSQEKDQAALKRSKRKHAARLPHEALKDVG